MRSTLLAVDVRVADRRRCASCRCSTTLAIHSSTFGCSYWRGIAELLAEVALADQDRADARHLREHVVEVLDAAACPRSCRMHENLALRVERPDVGAVVVVLLAEAPVAHRLAVGPSPRMPAGS